MQLLSNMQITHCHSLIIFMLTRCDRIAMFMITLQIWTVRCPCTWRSNYSILIFIEKSYNLVISSSPHRRANLSTFSPVGLLLLPQSPCRLNRRFVGIKSFCKSNPFILARLCKSKSYYLNLLCKSNPFIWFQVLSLAVDLYQHCYWEVTIGRDM